MRNTLFIIAFILVIVLVAFYIIVRHKIELITFSVVDIKFKKVSINEITGKLSLLITNSFGNIKVSDIKLDLYIDGYYVAALTQSKETTELLPNGNLMATIDFTFSPKKIVSIEHLLMSLSNYGKNTYTIKGNITVNKWFITARIPVDITDTFKSDEK